MRPGSVSGCGEHRQADQRNGRSDGEWTDVLQKQTWQPTETNHELQKTGGDDGALDLQKQTTQTEKLSFGCRRVWLSELQRTYLSDTRLPDVGRVEGETPVSIDLLCTRSEQEFASSPSSSSLCVVKLSSPHRHSDTSSAPGRGWPEQESEKQTHSPETEEVYARTHTHTHRM